MHIHRWFALYILTALAFLIPLSLLKPFFSKPPILRPSALFTTIQHLPFGVLAPPPTIPCVAPIIFRFGYDKGGYGDCLKGIVAVAQLAFLAGCSFELDFSQHPFGTVLPISPELLRVNSDRIVPIYDLGDWTLRSDSLRERNTLFAALAANDALFRTAGACISANLPHSLELASALHLDEKLVVGLAQTFLSSFYLQVINGTALGTFWLPPISRVFLVGIHVRMGDMFISAATHSKTDQRNPDIQEMHTALQSVASRAESLAGGLPVQYFACADTEEARAIVRDALSPRSVLTSHSLPVHIGYAATYGNGSLVEETLSVAREHFTLATANLVFAASNSGFSKTACAIARLNVPGASCLQRVGAQWAPLEPWEGVYVV